MAVQFLTLAGNVERMHRYFGCALACVLACVVMVYDVLLATVPDY